MYKQNTDELLDSLEQCEYTCRSIIGSGRLQELEQPLREFERLLKKASVHENIAMEYYYFMVVFHQINAGLYQNAKQIPKMKAHFLTGKNASEQFEAMIPLNTDPEYVSGKVKMMTLNCAEFARLASLAMETVDADAAWELALQTERMYDWLWSNLAEQSSIPAVEIHLKLASLYLILKDNRDESMRQLEIAQKKYLELYQRTGNRVYLEKSQNTVLGVSDKTEISAELLNSNPILSVLYRTARFTDMAAQAMIEQDDGQAAFYYEKAAREAEKLIASVHSPEAYRIAVMAFFGACVYLKETSLELAKQMAAHGLYVCDFLEKDNSSDFSSREISKMRKEFNKVLNDKKTGIFKHIFGH